MKSWESPNLNEEKGSAYDSALERGQLYEWYEGQLSISARAEVEQATVEIMKDLYEECGVVTSDGSYDGLPGGASSNEILSKVAKYYLSGFNRSDDKLLELVDVEDSRVGTFAESLLAIVKDRLSDYAELESISTETVVVDGGEVVDETKSSRVHPWAPHANEEKRNEIKTPWVKHAKLESVIKRDVLWVPHSRQKRSGDENSSDEDTQNAQGSPEKSLGRDTGLGPEIDLERVAWFVREKERITDEVKIAWEVTLDGPVSIGEAVKLIDSMKSEYGLNNEEALDIFKILVENKGILENATFMNSLSRRLSVGSSDREFGKDADGKTSRRGWLSR